MSEEEGLSMEYQSILSKAALIELLEVTIKTIEGTGTAAKKFKVKMRIKQVK